MRSCYTVQTQFYRDGGPLLTQLWYRCPPGAKPLPFPSSFMSLNWDHYPFYVPPIGETYTGPRAWSNGRTPPTAKGLAPFGPRPFFEVGQPWDPHGPVIPRDPFGLATACTGMQILDLGIAGAGVEISSSGDEEAE
jgi:hypothetical protein